MFRPAGRIRQRLIVGVTAGALAVGVFVGTLQSAEWGWRPALGVVTEPVTEMEPVLALPRTASVLALLEAEYHLESGRAYSAWQALKPFIDMEGPTGPAINITAARAASQWDWSRARSVLVGRPWLSSASDGLGLFYLARAEEELGDLNAAEIAYREYVKAGNATNRGVAQARWANLLDRLGDHATAAEAYRSASTDLPEIADWLETAAMEQLAKLGRFEFDRRSAAPTASAPVRMRRAQIEAGALAESGQVARALELLESEARALVGLGARTEAARLNVERARLILASSTPSTGRDLLRLTAMDGGVANEVRVEAARMLEELGDLSVSEQMARAAAYQAAGQPGAAADALQAALDAGGPDSGEIRLRLAQLRFEQRDYPAARAAFRWAAELLDEPEARAYAELYAARALFRTGGSRAERDAIAEFGRVAERYSSTAAAGTAFFLMGDEASSVQTALGYYRRAAAITHSPDARESLYRVGDRSLRLGNRAEAIEAWEEYLRRYPTGEQTALVAYELGKLHDAAGRRERAREAFTAAMAAEPTSYWAIRASERLGVRPLEGVLDNPTPWIGLASEPAEAAAVLRRLDALAAAGMEEQRTLEYQAALRAFERKPLALVTLAEGIRDRHEIVEGLNLGRRLLQLRGGVWDRRLLELVYPFPYRQLITAEAARAGIDPLLYAALIRQESTFRPTIKSRVGATGLGQIMPATGQWLAPSVGIRDYDHSLLEVPEVNLRMGTKFFADLLVRYGGAADLALAGYNAGPGRADRWRRQFSYGRDIDAFRAAIPFEETRNYVMVVLRNAAIYKRLYGSEISDYAPATAD